MELNDLIQLQYLLALLFFFVAFVYSSVGLGGGSSYTAILAIFGYGAAVIPMISLSLNLAVTTTGSVNYVRHGHVRPNLLLPFIATSMPMAYVGGALQLPKQVFFWLLLASLMFVAIRIYLWSSTTLKLNLGPRGRLIVSLLAGSVLGFIAGTVGIGGGIYLVPLILILGLGSAKEAAAAGSVFVWLNSLVGLVSRLQHNSISLMDYLPLILAVLAGGALGSYLGAVRYSAKTMERILGAVILVAIVVLAKKLVFG
jgi:uncharacterized membrane protein YfcA